MPEYVIHIGPPKVGSKYLQTSFAARSDSLKEIGVYYPVNDFSTTREVWHRILCDRLKSGDEQLKKIFEDLNYGGYSYIVLSFEGFFGLNDQALGYLKSLIDGNPIRIVYYCRRLSERIPSLWVQNVKEGFSEIFPQMYARALNDLFVAPDFNNRLVWERFARIFGRESINLVSFNNLVDNNTDPVEHFAETFLNLPKLPSIAQNISIIKNISPDVYHTEILRALNAIHIGRTGSRSDIVRRRFLSREDDKYTEILKAAMRSDLYSITIDERRSIFEIMYREQNSFKDRLINPTGGGDFFSYKPVEFQFVRQDYLLNRLAVETIIELYDNVMSK